MQDKEAHAKPIEQVVAGLRTHPERGLSQQEAQQRLQQLGANELTEKPRPGHSARIDDRVAAAWRLPKLLPFRGPRLSPVPDH